MVRFKNWKKIRDTKRTTAYRNKKKDVNVLVFKNPGGRRTGYGVEVDRGIGRVQRITPKFVGTRTGQLTKEKALKKARAQIRKIK